MPLIVPPNIWAVTNLGWRRHNLTYLHYWPPMQLLPALLGRVRDTFYSKSTTVTCSYFIHGVSRRTSILLASFRLLTFKGVLLGQPIKHVSNTIPLPWASVALLRARTQLHTEHSFISGRSASRAIITLHACMSEVIGAFGLGAELEAHSLPT